MCLLALCGLPLHASGQAPEGPAVALETLSASDGFHPGSVARLALQVKLGPGWHVNAHKPLDEYLVPTVLALNPRQGISVRETVYPDPVTITLAGTNEKLAAYSEEFLIGVELAIADNVAPGPYTLEGTLQYQACDSKQCFPPKTIPATLALSVVPADRPVPPRHEDAFAKIHFGTGQNAAVTALAPKAEEPKPETGDWTSAVSGFTVSGRAAGYLSATDFIAFLDRAESGQGVSEQNPLANRSLWFVFVFVIAGGLLLNLTPCVLPLIPINLGIIGAGAKAGSRTRGFLLGAAYGAGIALSYGVLGLVVVLGVSKTFGVINATPWFNAAIAIVFVLLALAMFDVFLIDFTRFQTRIGIKRKAGGSFVVAFVMGAISALLAGACVAPVIISTIVYAQDQYSKGSRVALILPFLIGVGMALPWPFAGAGLSFLPKPGKWMERVKYGFGILILGFAVYYGHLAYSLFSDRYLVDRQAVQSTAAEMDKEGWSSSLSQGLADAQREHKPVVLDFWATWCKNCLTMNQTTFKNGEVIKRLDPFVKIKFQAEDPNDPATRAVMEHFGVVGLPTYVVLTPSP